MRRHKKIFKTVYMLTDKFCSCHRKKVTGAEVGIEVGLGFLFAIGVTKLLI